MIEVKGTRSARPATSVADPLNLRHADVLKSNSISTLVGGLLALAVYLRSFLWFAPAIEADAETPLPAVPKAGISGGISRIDATDAPLLATAEDGVLPTPLPAVSGPFTTGIFAPLLQSALPYIASPAPANSALPTFPDASFPDASAPVAQPSPGAQPSPVAQPATSPAGPDPESGNIGAPLGEQAVRPPAAGAAQRNRAPQHSGPVNLGEVGSGAALAIAMSSLLSNSADADGDLLVAVQARVLAGALQPRSDGLLYIADTDALGTVQITYQVTDGTVMTVQTASLTVVENIRAGTDDADLLTGTDGRDRVLAAGSDDDIATFGGRDVVFGGAGSDNISGGSGRDTLYGDDGDDLIAGGADADLIFGGAGNDRIYGEAGDDHMEGEAGDDVLDGGSGNDALIGGSGDDTASAGAGDDLLAGGLGADGLSGDAGDDILFGDEGHDVVSGGIGADILFGGQSDDLLDGGAGNDVLSGDAGSDTLAGGEGADMLSGGQGCDLFIGASDAAPDILDGGDGVDRLDHASLPDDVTFDLIMGIASGAGTGQDSFSGIEAFVGGSGDDIFIAAHGNATLTGNAGSDTFGFRQGDTLDLSHPAYRITDFGLADMISLIGPRAGLELRKAQKDLEDRIEDLFEDFADRLDADEPKLRYFHEWAEDYRRTVIEVDFDRDNRCDLTVTLDGEHMLDLWRPPV